MVLELSQVVQVPVIAEDETKLAVVDRVVFDGAEVKLAGFQVKLPGVLPKFARLDYGDVLTCSRQTVVVDKSHIFSPDLKDFDALTRNFGEVVGVTAKTQSGDTIGRVSDLIFDVDSGLIVRFYLCHLFREWIIPCEYLVAITPKALIFKDIVGEPLFDDMVTAPAVGI